MVREAKMGDLKGLLELYLHLHEHEVPDFGRASAVWAKMMRDPGHHVIVFDVEGKVVSSCICVIILNLTRDVRPYALIENVVTHRAYRGNGYASQCLAYAKTLASEHDCYKIMLMTGSKDQTVLDFYKRAGFQADEKMAFIRRM